MSVLTRAGIPLAAVALVVSACTSHSNTDNPTVSSPHTSGAVTQPAPATSTPPPAVQVAATPTIRHDINPTTPITVSAKNGTLQSVRLVNEAGKVVTGAFSADKSSWHTTEVLGYSKSYHLTAKANGTSGETTRTLTRTFTTLTPDNMTLPYLDDIYGAPLQNGGTYGVAMVPVVHFDEVIPNRKAAEQALHVTTSPHVDGSWYWATPQDVHWRPRGFYTPGTKITVTAKVYGVNVGGGMYGQSDESVSFKIGRKQITIAYDTAPKSVNKIKVYRSGKLVHTMNTSMGEHTGERVNGKWINFYTLDGTYTVLGFENPAHMCSDTYGLPPNAAGGYPCEDIPWSTKISTDGIYLHELDTTIWAQNSGQDVSHGCLNLNHDNAHWFYTNSLVGDPVIIHGAKGAPHLQLWQGGDWSMTWAQWQKGSAL